MHDIAKPVSTQARVTSKRGAWGVAIGGLVALIILLVGIKGLQISKMMAAGKEITPPPVTVTSAVVKEENWAPVLPAIGSVSAVQGAIVATELGGVVSEIKFENGGVAKKGDVIVKLDASQEEALLRSAEAEAELARTDLERAQGLASQKVVSKAELDAAESKFRRLTAIADQMRSNIRKKTLVEFKGKLTAVNSMVDPVTRNVSVQATLENPDHALRPGMFAKTEVELPEKRPVLVIPGSAVSYAPFGDSVFVIEKKKDEKTGKESEVIRQQFVRVGEARGDFVSITNGLKAGETVVGTGVFKLRNGMAVAINNDLAPKPQVNPTPVDS